MSSEISIVHGDINNLNDIQGLWEELNQLHLDKSIDFKQYFRDLTFDSRKGPLVNSAEKGKLLVVIAYHNGNKIGYCVSDVVDGIGEVQSIYIKPDYRSSHIGNTLIRESLDWIKSWGAERIIVKVSVGNEEVFGFYAKCGFAPRFAELQFIP